MEFYTVTCLMTAKKTSFNSQRDGILLSEHCQYTRIEKFQFPTGWNSTSKKYNENFRIFRFNSQRDGILLKTAPPLKTATNSFNSQRDGILLKPVHNLVFVLLLFQFPTGWNSTVDGIVEHCQYTFQFPTGWNSTGYRCSCPRSLQMVSIPNGMEFYGKECKLGDSKRSFNSQRDGILQRYKLFRYPKALVSIPNGMEFYDLRRSWNSLLKRKFQFPTGWNSTIDLALSFSPIFSVSIPNGMEFYWHKARRRYS